jgi:hypothetical protein
LRHHLEVPLQGLVSVWPVDTSPASGIVAQLGVEFGSRRKRPIERPRSPIGFARALRCSMDQSTVQIYMYREIRVRGRALRCGAHMASPFVANIIVFRKLRGHAA